MSPVPLLLLGCPSLEGAPWPPSQQLRDLGQVSSVSLSPLCNGTTGFLGGTVEDSVSRGPPVLLAPDASLASEVPTGWVPGGLQGTAPQEPRLPEVRQPEATPPGSPQWGSDRS